MKTLHTIKLNKTSGKDIIADSKLFSYIDSDFRNWKADEKGKPTKAMKLEVLEIDKDMTLKEIFPNPEKQVLTQSQILDFCKSHKDKLLDTGYSNLFIFKSNDNFFVAGVCVEDDGSLRVDVFRLGVAYVYDASDRHRVVRPQLDSKTLSSEPLDSSILERLEKVEEFISNLKKLCEK